MRQLYSRVMWDKGCQTFWSESKGVWVADPKERDIFTKAWLDQMAVHWLLELKELIARPTNYVHIYDFADGAEVQAKRKTPYSYLQWADDVCGEHKAYQSDTALKAAVKRRWDEAETLGMDSAPRAHVHHAFCCDELTDYSDFCYERGPRGGIVKVQA